MLYNYKIGEKQPHVTKRDVAYVLTYTGFLFLMAGFIVGVITVFEPVR